LIADSRRNIILIVVQVYKRAEHSIKVFEGLERNQVSSFLVSFDKASDSESQSAQEEMIGYLDRKKSLSVEKLFHRERLGLANAVVETVSKVLEVTDRIIFLEDDCVVRSGAIPFFHEGLRALENNRQVRTICGYSYPLRNLHWGKNQELMYAKRFSSWGWGTWRDRWSDYTRDLRYLVKCCHEKEIAITSIGVDIAKMLARDEYLAGGRDIWSLSWTLLHFLTDTYAVFPRETFIDNIGFDGSGVHCQVTPAFQNSVHRSLFKRYDWSSISHEPKNEELIRKFMAKNGEYIY
jgi:hypothetical protein